MGITASGLRRSRARRAARVLGHGGPGYSYDEIAAQLGVSYTNVNRHLVRARSAVRAARDRY